MQKISPQCDLEVKFGKKVNNPAFAKTSENVFISRSQNHLHKTRQFNPHPVKQYVFARQIKIEQQER